LAAKGVLIPDGFAVTATAYRYFLSFNRLEEILKSLMQELDRKDFSNLDEIGVKARKLIMEGHLPADLELAVVNAYDDLFDNDDREVAVRSSATA